jgi:hypothetical protein
MAIKASKLSRATENVLILNRKSRPKPSIVYDTYWRFAAERQNIFFKRVTNQGYPWTDDQILNKYKFTNIYRATDRVSQYLIKSVIYTGDQNPGEVFFRLILFKLFNRISTWEFLLDELGDVSLREYSFKRYDKLLSELLDKKVSIYSGAYIMASGRSAFGFKRKHQNHLKLIEKMIKDAIPYKLQECRDMESVYKLLLTYPSIGEFLAYQFTIDINYSLLTNFSEMDFVRAGPGAKDGIAKCFKDFANYSFEDIIKMTTENQNFEFERLGLNFHSLWGRDLQLIDCQNVFCEVDKYSRVAHPKIIGYSNRVRIKQKFSQIMKDKIEFYFPPKWGIKPLPV